MANYHFEVQVISRGKGRSAVSAAAYRAGEELIDEKTGVVSDYRAKKDILQTTLLIPEGAPEWMKDRSSQQDMCQSPRAISDHSLGHFRSCT